MCFMTMPNAALAWSHITFNQFLRLEWNKESLVNYHCKYSEQHEARRLMRTSWNDSGGVFSCPTLTTPPPPDGEKYPASAFPTPVVATILQTS